MQMAGVVTEVVPQVVPEVVLGMAPGLVLGVVPGVGPGVVPGEVLGEVLILGILLLLQDQILLLLRDHRLIVGITIQYHRDTLILVCLDTAAGGMTLDLTRKIGI